MIVVVGVMVVAHDPMVVVIRPSGGGRPADDRGGDNEGDSEFH
jgi:hypothetical protein